jgi:hypothetical protein
MKLQQKNQTVLKAKQNKVETLEWHTGVQLYRLFGSVDWEAYSHGQGELTISAQRNGKYAISENSVTGNDIALWQGQQGACAMVGKLSKDGKSIQSGHFVLSLEGFRNLSTHINGKGIERRFTGKGTVDGKQVRVFTNTDTKKLMTSFFLQNGKITRNQHSTISTKAHCDKWCRGLAILA